VYDVSQQLRQRRQWWQCRHREHGCNRCGSSLIPKQQIGVCGVYKWLLLGNVQPFFGVEGMLCVGACVVSLCLQGWISLLCNLDAVNRSGCHQQARCMLHLCSYSSLRRLAGLTSHVTCCTAHPLIQRVWQFLSVYLASPTGSGTNVPACNHFPSHVSVLAVMVQ